MLLYALPCHLFLECLCYLALPMCIVSIHLTRCVLYLKNDVQLVTQFPQSRRQALDVLSAAESVLPISDSEVTCGPMARPATPNSSATSSSNSTDFSSSSSSLTRYMLFFFLCFFKSLVFESAVYANKDVYIIVMLN